MPTFLSFRAAVPTCVAGLGLILGACSSMTTYGTGKTAAAQTVEDIGGILSLGANKKKEPPIDYKPRAPIVEPPVIAGLPPPGSETTGAIAAADWPKDPDELARKQEAIIQEMVDAGKTPKFTVPQTDEPIVTSQDDGRPGPDHRTSVERLRDSQRIDSKSQKKLFTEAKMAKTGSFDEEGRPIRRYLTEPPVPYREPDLASPVSVTEKPKEKRKFKWPDLWPF